MVRQKPTRPMNESKYPKSLSILLALNLCALLVTLIFSMEDIWEGVHVVMGIQVIVLALGLILIVLPKAKGKRLGMLGILGMAIAAPVIILYCGHLLAESGGMDRTEQRVFTLLCFYAAAIPLLIVGVVVVHEGWDSNPNSVRRQCFLYLCFLLGVAGGGRERYRLGAYRLVGNRFCHDLAIVTPDLSANHEGMSAATDRNGHRDTHRPNPIDGSHRLYSKRPIEY